MSLSQINSIEDFRVLQSFLQLPMGERRRLNSGKNNQLNSSVLQELGLNPEQAQGFFYWLNDSCNLTVPLKSNAVDEQIAKLNLDAKTDEKLRTLLTDLSRFQNLRADHKQIAVKKFSDAGGQVWLKAAESFMGLRRPFSSNSDSCTKIERQDGSVLLGAVADGVSGNDKRELKLSTGQKASRAVIEYFESGDFDFKEERFRLILPRVEDYELESLKLKDYLLRIVNNSIISEKPSRQYNKNLLQEILPRLVLANLDPEMNLLDIFLTMHNARFNRAHNGFEAINEDKGLDKSFLAKYTKSSYLGIKSSVLMDKLKQDALDFYTNLNTQTIAGKLLVEKFPLTLKVFTALSLAENQIAKNISDFAANENLDTKNCLELKPATTLAMAFDAGDQVMLVALGDSIAFAYKDGKIIKDSINTPHCYFGSIYSMLSVSAYNHLDPQKFKGDREFTVSIKFVNKKDIDGIFLASDGITEHPAGNYQAVNSILRKEDKDIRSILVRALNHAYKDDVEKSKCDDKTVMLLQKAN